MSIAEPDTDQKTEAVPSRRPARRVIMHWVRRLHLYFGLFLFPWALLYGVTGFLFNHPEAFSDQPRTVLGREALRDTPMESPPSPEETAAEVVEELNRRSPAAGYRLAGDARYAREFALATARTPAGERFTAQVAANGAGVTLRTLVARPGKDSPAPFAVGSARQATRGKRGGRTATRQNAGADSLRMAQPLHERIQASLAIVLERQSIDATDVTITNVPDLVFKMHDKDGTTWNVTHNAQAGTVTGTRADEDSGPTLSVRRFLTRLHLAHGYPWSVGSKWLWAVVVDAMAFVLVFWGVSGLFMWWQIKATRLLGIAVVVLSLAAAVALTVGMWRVLAS